MFSIFSFLYSPADCWRRSLLPVTREEEGACVSTDFVFRCCFCCFYVVFVAIHTYVLVDDKSCQWWGVFMCFILFSLDVKYGSKIDACSGSFWQTENGGHGATRLVCARGRRPRGRFAPTNKCIHKEHPAKTIQPVISGCYRIFYYNLYSAASPLIFAKWGLVGLEGQSKQPPSKT